MDDGSRPRIVWRPNTATGGVLERPQNYEASIDWRQRGIVNRSETTGNWRDTSNEKRTWRKVLDTGSGPSQFKGTSFSGMERTTSVGNHKSHNMTEASNQNQDEGWTPAKGRKGSGSRNPGEEILHGHKKGHPNEKYKGVQNRGHKQRYDKSTILTQLDSLNDWNQLSALNSPLRIMLKLQEFESSWVPSFHSNAPLEVIDVALVQFCQFDNKWKYERLALMKSLFTPSFCERLRLLLEECKKTWFSCGKDKVVTYVKHIRHTLEFILTNDLSFHGGESTEARILSSLCQECISLLSLMSAKLVDLTGATDAIIEQEISKIEELSTIEYVGSFELDKPVYPEDFMSAPDVLMPNIVCGPYQNDHHYVETHFLLLKEDFESNLREGVEQYLHDSKQRNHKIWVYQNVVVELHISKSVRATEPCKILYHVSFPECKYLSNIQWDHTKRFMFGSLVVLTNNDFKTYYLAVIEDRFLKEPPISIAVRPISSLPNGFERYKYLLVEPKVLYEPYFQSLKMLKRMGRVGVPLKKYLVNADATPRLPSYIDRDTNYKIGRHDIKVCDVLAWPNAEDLGLNLSQREAFINSLTREMTLIQGPPGTGKTFLALKIVETLLSNRINTRSFRTEPIMIVCYKNHSLDQILEGLLKKGVSIVRIGSRSKVPEIQEKCLARYLPNPPRTNNVNDEKDALESNLDYVLMEVADIAKTIKLIKSRIGIIHTKFLVKFMGNNILHQKLSQWLLEPLRDVPLSFTPLESIYYLHGHDSVSHIESFFEINLNDLGRGTLELKKKLNEDDSVNERFWSSYYSYNLLASGLNLDVDSSDCPNPQSIDFPGYNHLNLDERWALYNSWEQEYICELENNIILLQNRVQGMTEVLHEFEQMVLGLKLRYRQPDVIGATTSGAAKHYSALADVKAKVVLVEEAAEVLEAHVIAAISDKCEHLIMIGDHQQLRPTTASFKLEKHYGMSTSLFERMINNRVAWSSLTTQHRMRPEIVALICPSIYPNLLNSPSVGQYPDVLGTNKNVFFFDHNHPEKVGLDSESKFNPEEADMLLAICSYLIKQGYSSDSITILSTYLAQDRYISKRIKQEREYEQFNHTVVDNYQGEENTIILLSLVRSNEQGEIGFLSTKNRVCVALSRAKHGLFIFGNMSCLKMKDASSIWGDVNEVLVSQESISTKFPLKCVRHNNISEVVSPIDVNALTNGGCSNPCGAVLPCGHTCSRLCHAKDQTHEFEFECSERCSRKCPNDHNCSAQCTVSCPPCSVPMQKRLVCGHSVQLECAKPNLQYYCIETVEIQMDTCGHNQMVLCRDTVTPERITCQALCLKEITCGHICKRKCHFNSDPDHTKTHICLESCELINKSCPRKHKCNKKCSDPCGDCLVDVERYLVCNHKVVLPCSQDLVCKEKCSKKLPCNHDCVNLCHEKCGPCIVKVAKVIEDCGHTVMVICSKDPSLVDCKGRCNRMKSCGHQCSGLCKDDCTEQFCEVMEEVELPCGHKLSETCGKLEKNRHDTASMCQAACTAVLPCGHECAGTCGECLQNRIHVPCTRTCMKTVICSHKCRHSCHDVYHTCPEKACVEKCWGHEMNNRSFYNQVKTGKGKKKRIISVFNPLEKLILNVRHALAQKCRSSYARDLPPTAPIAEVLRQIRAYVTSTFNRTNTDRKELRLLKTSMFLTEFATVSRAVYSRLVVSKMSSTKKSELERLLVKLVHSVNTRRDDMGSYAIQQFQEQMVWVSLNIYAHDIDDSKGDVGALRQRLEEAKYSFGIRERCAAFEQLQDLKSDPATPPGTDPCDLMFPDTAQWSQPIYHHLLPDEPKVEKDTADVITKHEGEAITDAVDGQKPRVDSIINLTGEEDGRSTKDSSNVPSISPPNLSIEETPIHPSTSRGENYGAGAQQVPANEGTGGQQQPESVNTDTPTSSASPSGTTVSKPSAFMEWLSGNTLDREPSHSSGQTAVEDGGQERLRSNHSAIGLTNRFKRGTSTNSSIQPNLRSSRRLPLQSSASNRYRDQFDPKPGYSRRPLRRTSRQNNDTYLNDID